MKSIGTKRKKNKNLKLALGVGTLAVMVGLGSTLAANISLNSGGPVEFGQGVAQTISCQSIPEGYNFSSPSAAPSPAGRGKPGRRGHWRQ